MKIETKIKKTLKKRYRKERIFKRSGQIAIILAIAFLVILFSSIIFRGTSAFITHKINLLVEVPQSEELYRNAVKKSLREKFPEVKQPLERAALYRLVSRIAHLEVKKQVAENPHLVGQKLHFKVTASSDVDMFLKEKIDENIDEELRKLKNNQIFWIKKLQEEDLISKEFNWNFFKYADSAEPEVAGMAASIIGSFLTMFVFLLIAFPVGVMTGFYLQEFAPKNKLTNIAEVTINNLAAIPSIIFGLLGLVVYLNFMHLPRSAAVVGGLTLAMLFLPIIIIATRNAIKTIPKTIKEGAIALGASEVQVMFHHTFPLALPGIMTGTILAVSRALGETAPLLMIGMVAFIADIPSSFFDPTTTMPVQIYLWSDSPELGFAEKSAAAIMVLLFFLVLFNAIAVFIRNKFERKW